MKLKLIKIEEYIYDTGKESVHCNLKWWADYAKRMNNWKIVEIDGKEVIQYCENCHVPLVDGDKYIVDIDGCYICQECYDKIKDEV